MKKIVGILGMAAVLGSAAFAAEPAANFVMADFTGSADFGWESNFAEEKNGFYNAPSASVKFGFVDAGDKTTTGDGIWGELKISVGATSVTDGKIKLGDKNHAENFQASDFTHDADNNKYVKLPNLFPTAGVDVAKIHFVDGDFRAALSILSPSLNYDNFAPSAATGIGYGAGGLVADKDNATLTNGFAVNLGYDKFVDFNFKLKNDGVKKENKWGMAFDATVTPIDGLKVFAAGTFNFDAKYNGFGATADYKLGITDKMYVKPGVGFDYAKAGDKETKHVAAGLLFGWGAENVKPELPFVNSASDKFNEGVSVTVLTDMEDKGLQLNVGLYDQSVLSLLGDDFGTLKTGVDFRMAQKYTEKDVTILKGKNELAIGAKYDVTFSPVYVSLNGGMSMVMIEDAEKNTVSYSMGLTFGSKEVIDNTDLYISYSLAGNSAADKLTANDLKIGTKISF